MAYDRRAFMVIYDGDRMRMVEMRGLPKIVCLCGSTRFMEAFKAANFTETLRGNIVLTVGCDTRSDEGLGLSADIKAKLDELHKRKIDLCDEVFVLNCQGYIGESTRSEIEYAWAQGKAVRYLEVEDDRNN